jgi:hypothetical protein
MPVALALVFGVAVLAVLLIGILWSLAFLLVYAYIGAAIYLIWRSKRKEAELVESMVREAERQRLFNEQEMRAWRDTLGKEQPNASRRENSLRSFDRTRDPSQK